MAAILQHLQHAYLQWKASFLVSKLLVRRLLWTAMEVSTENARVSKKKPRES